MTRLQSVAKPALAALALAAGVCLLGTPAVADNYQVTATFAHSNSPDPSTLTFDYSGSLSYAGIVSPSLVTFDHACSSACSIILVTWDTLPLVGGLDVTFSDGGHIYNTDISLPLGISATGSYTGFLTGGNVTVTDPPSTGVPETSSYLELLATSAGLALWGFRRRSVRLTA